MQEWTAWTPGPQYPYLSCLSITKTCNSVTSLLPSLATDPARAPSHLKDYAADIQSAFVPESPAVYTSHLQDALS